MRPEVDAACRRRSARSCAETVLAEQKPLPLPCNRRFQVEAGIVVRGNANGGPELRLAGPKLFDLARPRAPVDWAKQFWHLPVKDLLSLLGGPKCIFADSMPVATGGMMVARTPNAPTWYRGGL